MVTLQEIERIQDELATKKAQLIDEIAEDIKRVEIPGANKLSDSMCIVKLSALDDVWSPEHYLPAPQAEIVKTEAKRSSHMVAYLRGLSQKGITKSGLKLHSKVVSAIKHHI